MTYDSALIASGIGTFIGAAILIAVGWRTWRKNVHLQHDNTQLGVLVQELHPLLVEARRQGVASYYIDEAILKLADSGYVILPQQPTGHHPYGHATTP